MADRVYDGTTFATVSGTELDGVLPEETVALVVSDARFGDRHVGSGKAVTGVLSLSGADAANYRVQASATTAAGVTPRPVAGWFTVADKYYDGTPTATITGTGIVGGPVDGDDLALLADVASFDSGAAGKDKLVTGTGFTLGGADVRNYVLASSTLTTRASVVFGTVSGFATPVDMTASGSTVPVYNTLRAGSTVPLKFEVFARPDRAGEIRSVETTGATVSSRRVNCLTGASEVPVEALSTGSTVLRFDTAGDQFVYNWKSPTSIGCYLVTVALADSATIGAWFMTK